MLELSSKYTKIPKWILTKAGSYKRNIIMLPREYETSDDNVITKTDKLEIERVNQMQENLKTQKEKSTKKVQSQADIKYARIKKINERKRAVIDKEIVVFARKLMSSMADLTDEDIVKKSMILLYNEQAFEKLVPIYVNNTNAHLEKFEYRSVVRKALLRNIELVSTRIEARHKEFPQVEVSKVIRL